MNPREKPQKIPRAEKEEKEPAIEREPDAGFIAHSFCC
jgi:hypothetical protein